MGYYNWIIIIIVDFYSIVLSLIYCHRLDVKAQMIDKDYPKTTDLVFGGVPIDSHDVFLYKGKWDYVQSHFKNLIYWSSKLNLFFLFFNILQDSFTSAGKVSTGEWMPESKLTVSVMWGTTSWNAKTVARHSEDVQHPNLMMTEPFFNMGNHFSSV